jgi:hypothetical protein
MKSAHRRAMKTPLIVLIACAAPVLGSGACHLPDSAVSSVAPSDDSDEVWAQRPPKHGDELSMPAAPGRVRTVDEPMRSIEGAPGGRVRMLELYQNALSEKEELARRVTETVRDRDAAVARAGDLEKARADLEAKTAGLAAENQDLRAKALELARRLAESELARLQAEKTALDSTSAGAASEKP